MRHASGAAGHIPAAAAAPLDAAPLAVGSDRAADVGRAGRQRVPSLAVALLAVARFAPPLVLGAALRHLPPRLFLYGEERLAAGCRST